MKTKLKYLRQSAGLSQDEMAKLIGVSKSCISAWENGVRVPGVDKVLSYIRVLDLDPDLFEEELAASNMGNCFDMTLLNAAGVKEMHDLYRSLIKKEEYLKKY